MLAQDLVLQLAARLPRFTDKFTTNVSISSLTRSVTTVTANTIAAHGFIVGQGVNIIGAETPITLTSFTRVGLVGTIITSADHDLTFGPQIQQTGLTVNTSGASEAEFNGDFTVTGILNRRTLSVAMADTGATTATGAPQVNNASSALQQYNGLFAVATVPTTTSFTYEITNTTILDPGGVIVARGNARISAVNSLEVSLAAYTEQPQPNLWMFVSLDDVAASKSRQILSDATDNIQRSDHFRQQIIQQCSLHVFIPTSEEIAGRNARDLAEQLFRPICQSVLFKRFNTQLFVGEYNPLQFLAHSFTTYTNAFYVHTYVFEQVADLLFEDTVGIDEDVAFRDIDLTMGVDVGTGELTATIDLDESPLP